MTESHLRALTQKWRTHGQGWSLAAQYARDRCADELTELLTTRQEVAPVADAVYQVRLTNGSGRWYEVDKREFDECVADSWIKRILLPVPETLGARGAMHE